MFGGSITNWRKTLHLLSKPLLSAVACQLWCRPNLPAQWWGPCRELGGAPGPAPLPHPSSRQATGRGQRRARPVALAYAELRGGSWTLKPSSGHQVGTGAHPPALCHRAWKWKSVKMALSALRGVASLLGGNERAWPHWDVAEQIAWEVVFLPALLFVHFPVCFGSFSFKIVVFFLL